MTLEYSESVLTFISVLCIFRLLVNILSLQIEESFQHFLLRQVKWW